MLFKQLTSSHSSSQYECEEYQLSDNKSSSSKNNYPIVQKELSVRDFVDIIEEFIEHYFNAKKWNSSLTCLPNHIVEANERLRNEFIEFDSDFLDVNTISDMFDLLTEKIGDVSYEHPIEKDIVQLQPQENINLDSVPLTTTPSTIIEHGEHIYQPSVTSQLSIKSTIEIPKSMMENNKKEEQITLLKSGNEKRKYKNKKIFRNFFKFSDKKKKSITIFLKKLNNIGIGAVSSFYLK
ncbi:hypothetical protein SNEBB_003368 [Seison nebaliae]|nr:hypothetical protein SNEBB_003368 [Seison nebaliae]